MEGRNTLMISKTVPKQRKLCGYRFKYPGSPRKVCRLRATGDGLCIFHTPKTENKPQDFQYRLEQAVAQGRWLEGVQICTELRGANLSAARMPEAVFQNARVTSTDLRHSDLRKSSFQSCTLQVVILSDCDLSGAAFEGASFQTDPKASYSIDLRNSEIGGASFMGIERLGRAKLLGIRLSTCTRLEDFRRSDISGDIYHSPWGDAATIYTTFSRRAREDAAYELADHFAYMAASCWHREALGLGNLRGNAFWDWVLPTFIHIKGPAWLLHRVIWGYGLSPLRNIGIIIIVAFYCSILWLPVSTAPYSDRLLECLSFSLLAFVGANAEGFPPEGLIYNVLFGSEALAGLVLLSMFLVALSGKYLRRN